MRALLPLALSSLRARRSTVLLTVVTVAMSVSLLLGVERLRQEARSSFLRSVSGTDLIVGARAHPVQLLLYSVFRLGDASNNLRWDSVQWLQGNPDVAWSVPISLGDSHRGFRVVGTTPDYFKRIGTREQRELAFAAGQPFDALFDVVLGAEVARALSYRVGDELVLAHGTAQVALQTHEDRPFKVSGVLAATGTAIDQALYVSLPALEAIHLNWRSGTRIGKAPDLDTLSPDRLQPRTVTAVFVGLASRTSTFSVQRAINQYGDEPLSAVLPGVALQQLWGMLATIERVLSAAAACVVAAGFMVLLTSVLATLNERRREMAVLRAVGASARHIFALMLAEATLLATAGAVLGLIVVELALLLVGPWLQTRYGIFIQHGWVAGQALLFLSAVAALGAAVGLVPATLAARRSIQDGITPRT